MRLKFDLWNLLLHMIFDTLFMVICLSERIAMNNNKNIVHNQKHLTLSDRTFIEQELCMGSSFKSISKVLCKDPTTISKEVQKNRKSIKGKHVAGNCKDCKHWDDCTVRGKERSEPRKR